MSLGRGNGEQTGKQFRHSLLPVVTCSGHKEALWVKESMDFLFYTLLSEQWLYLTSGGPAALVREADVCPAQSTDVSD